MAQPLQLYWVDTSEPGAVSSEAVWTAVSNDGGATWSAPTQVYSVQLNPPAGVVPSPFTTISYLSAGNTTPETSLLIQIIGPDRLYSVPLPVGVPTSIDDVNLPVAYDFNLTMQGVFTINGHKYVFAEQRAHALTSVWKDGVIQDALHQPPSSGAFFYWDQVSNFIQFAYTSAGTTVQLLEYNLTTDLYTANHDPVTLPGGSTAQYVYNLPNGDVVLIFADAAAQQRFHITQLHAGVWSAPQDFTSNVDPLFAATYHGAMIDANSTVHLFYDQFGDAGDPNESVGFYRQLAGGVLSVPFSFTAVFGDEVFGDNNGWVGHGRIANNTLYMPVLLFDTGLGATFMGIAVGTPLSNPVWTLTRAYTQPQFPDSGPLGGILVFAAPPIVIACPVGNPAFIGSPFFTHLTVTGGTPPYTFALTGGALPAGLSLVTSGALAGYITGIPSSGPLGSYSYTVQVTDSMLQTATITCALQLETSAQLIFQGVRRQKGPRPVATKSYAYRAQNYTYRQDLVINALGTFPPSPGTNPFIVRQTIQDNDFDWMELRIVYTPPPLPTGLMGLVGLPRSLTAITLYDSVKQQMSNLPVLDVYYNGAQGSLYANGAQVPAVEYPVHTQIRLDVYSLITNPDLLPMTVSFYFVGSYRIPC